MILRKLKSTKPICRPSERFDTDTDVKEENGEPVGNALAIAVYNNPENYPEYEIIP